MAYSPYRFAGPVSIPSVPTNLFTFTQPSIIKQIILTNFTGGLLSFSMYLVPAGSQVGDNSNKLYGDYSLPANSTVSFTHSLVVGTGEKIYAVANVPNSINVIINGVTAG